MTDAGQPGEAGASRGAADRLLRGLLDATLLTADAPVEAIERLCRLARGTDGVGVAAVCVHPVWVGRCRVLLHGSGVRVATVVNFPYGGHHHPWVLQETDLALAAGADEIDLVYPWRAHRAGAWTLPWRSGGRPRGAVGARQLVREVVRRCGPKRPVKLILETGAWPAALWQGAARAALDEGVRFLKTSTGVDHRGATVDAVSRLLGVIEAAGCGGIKVSGGVRTLEDARVYLNLIGARLGMAQVTPARVRIGSSVLHEIRRCAD